MHNAYAQCNKAFAIIAQVKRKVISTEDYYSLQKKVYERTGKFDMI
jgi:hypothetical protein